MRFADDFIPTNEREWDQVRAALLEASDWKCDYCERPLRWRKSSIDHRIPRIQGGTDHFVNLTICCGSCNSSKGGQTTNDWDEQR